VTDDARLRPPIPPLDPEAPPLAILIDYDGTIALTDVTDTVLAEHVPGAWEGLDELYLLGEVGSRWLMEQQAPLLPADPSALLQTAAAQPHDPAFVPFVERALAAGIHVEIVSDGFGFFIGPAMKALGLPEIPIVTARTTFGPSGTTIGWPNGNPDCLVCGTCKRLRVLGHQAAGRAVVFVGDGESDRYAAAHADRIFAKRRLVTVCEENGWEYTRWHGFDELDSWLEWLLEDWRHDPGAIAPPAPRPFICGPEVWGSARIGAPGEVKRG
jgi:2-hydroxy-3-keto-5-methylthiopentenyl-1-phosphate phosphatase